ncbi:bromodomain-containing protein 8 isoform X2 [Cataglyphis hispanica]|uniref:bromodomain-containing protein 8 isoform X2 n=1 Tax=Cataglyphis hispanica TaxID=1086592 RepID=UPI00217FD9AA|nr:bromodomain-containing protein 8 isoform X2 [Cataglyphis hispanica]
MASMQDRLKLKRANCDAWTIREQLCLASSVLKSGDQNWISVSRSLKPFIEKESLRPPDWFSQKSCAMQYASLLENADTPKRKKRESGETTSESIVRRLTQERITELNQTLACQKEEYLRLKADINLLKSGAVSDEKLEKMWLEIQQEEREMDQKARAHMAWLTKRQQQQKQEMSLSPAVSSSITGQTRKHAEGTMEVAQTELASESASENDDERKTNRGGRSPLLTSLLKSPSPTTQAIQTYPSTPVQVTSPTITSLLGSNSKILNAQLTQNVSPQLQQLVSTAIASANATSPPSVGAPTLSMLLEMPATTQRGPLPKLQTTNSVGIISQIQQQQAAAAVTASTEMHKFEQTIQPQSQVRQMNIQNEVVNAATVTVPTATTISAAVVTTSALTAVVTAPTNVPVSENMVQIIDHIDDVLRKDIMADVMDKDEINEIIGDIEELIKEEITGSPQTRDTGASTMTTTTSTAVINSLSSMPRQTAEIPIVEPKIEPKPEPRDVDETVSLSDSPRSEMAIEEIDSSTSNIAEIIGTVAIEPQEPKIIVTEITEIISNAPEEIKSEPSTCDDERIVLTEELVPELETNDEENSKDIPMEEKQLDIEIKSMDTVSSNVEVNDSKLLDETKETMEDTVVAAEVEEEDGDKEEETEVIAHDDKESLESVKELKESPEDTEGDQQDVPSTEVVSVSSEVTNDLPSTEDTEKSQDISLILEDDESSQSSENKKKAVAEEQIIENMVESTESSESFKEDSMVLIKEKTIVEEVKKESSVKSQEEEAIEETLEIYTDEFKKEEVKDSSEDTTSSILQNAEIKEEEIGSEPVVLPGAENTSPVVIEEVKSIKNELIEIAIVDANVTNIENIESAEVKPEESKTESEIDTTNSAFCPKSPLPPEEDKKEIIVEIKQEKEDTMKNMEGEQNIKKEIESTEEHAELDEEEPSLSKLSGGRAMKTYSKKQNITVDSEPENESTGEGADYRAWKKAVMLVYNRLATHKYASVFLRPITEDQAPGYHSVIFRPMDLSTIKKNIDNGTIRSTMHFQRDVMLMFQNAIMYNKHDTFIYKMAVSMQEECLQHMQILVQVTGEGSFRRETRTAASSSSEASESSIKRKRSHITPSPHDTDSPRSKKRRKSEND